MSESKPGPNVAQGESAEDRARSSSRRRVLKAAAAAAPVVMSLKARSAYAQTDGSHALSNNLSTRPTTPG